MSKITSTSLNKAQLEILQLFSQDLTEKQIEELRSILVGFRAKLLEDHVKKVVVQKKMTNNEINDASTVHRPKVG